MILTPYNYFSEIRLRCKLLSKSCYANYLLRPQSTQSTHVISGLMFKIEKIIRVANIYANDYGQTEDSQNIANIFKEYSVSVLINLVQNIRTRPDGLPTLLLK